MSITFFIGVPLLLSLQLYVNRKIVSEISASEAEAARIAFQRKLHTRQARVDMTLTQFEAALLGNLQLDVDEVAMKQTKFDDSMREINVQKQQLTIRVGENMKHKAELEA